MRETEKYTEKWVRREWLEDPVCKKESAGDRAWLTRRNESDAPPGPCAGYLCAFFSRTEGELSGSSGGARTGKFCGERCGRIFCQFFGGFLTTCGLLNAGRPCRENGRAFGLHGCISNTACTRTKIYEDASMVRVCALVEENHPQGKDCAWSG